MFEILQSMRCRLDVIDCEVNVFYGNNLTYSLQFQVGNIQWAM